MGGLGLVKCETQRRGLLGLGRSWMPGVEALRQVTGRGYGRILPKNGLCWCVIGEATLKPCRRSWSSESSSCRLLGSIKGIAFRGWCRMPCMCRERVVGD
jgi:hypothetical protein